jgi:hypothetical protein
MRARYRRCARRIRKAGWREDDVLVIRLYDQRREPIEEA